MIEFDPDFRTIDVAITCHDIDESLKFYGGTLGFEVVVDLEVPSHIATGIGLASSGFRHVRLQAGNTLIKLMDIEPPPPEATHDFSSGVRWLTIFVKSVEETTAYLKSKGVSLAAEPFTVSEEDEQPGVSGSAVAAYAPDGLLIEFVQG